MYNGPIIDTHMHIWDLNNPPTWLTRLSGGVLNHRFEVPDYLKMCQNQPISHAIYIECGGFPQNRVLETKWVQQQADKFGFPQGIVAFAQLDHPDVEQTLQQQVDCRNLKAIRMPLNFVAGSFGAERDDYMQDPSWRKGFSLLEKFNLGFEMQIFDVQIPNACELMKAFPNIPVILEHLGWPIKATMDDLPTWSQRLRQIAKYSNVSLKLSCLGWIFQNHNQELMISYIREAVRIFGAERCMVGSNCPPDTVFISFDDIFRILKTALSIYPQSEQEKIFYSNAKKNYRL